MEESRFVLHKVEGVWTAHREDGEPAAELEITGSGLRIVDEGTGGGTCAYQELVVFDARNDVLVVGWNRFVCDGSAGIALCEATPPRFFRVAGGRWHDISAEVFPGTVEVFEGFFEADPDDAPRRLAKDAAGIHPLVRYELDPEGETVRATLDEVLFVVLPPALGTGAEGLLARLKTRIRRPVQVFSWQRDRQRFQESPP
jgi:hypothetical protein